MQGCRHVRPLKAVGVGLLPCVPQVLGLCITQLHVMQCGCMPLGFCQVLL